MAVMCSSLSYTQTYTMNSSGESKKKELLSINASQQ